MNEYINIGKINTDKLKIITKNAVTDEVILTSERFEHILEKHKDDFELYFNNIMDIINNPDYILNDIKNIDTLMLIKHIDETNINVILRLAIADDEIHCKNSVMTMYRIRDKNLKKLILKNKCIYKNE